MEGPSIAPQKQFVQVKVQKEDGKGEVFWAVFDEVDEIRHDSKVPVSGKGYLALWDDKGGAVRPY